MILILLVLAKIIDAFIKKRYISAINISQPLRRRGSIVETGNVLVIGDTLHMWYDGRLSPVPPNQQQIGHATLTIDKLLTIVHIEHSSSSGLPAAVSLEQNYPNPFNPKTIISYQLPVISEVELSIYNILGQKVATLVSEKQPAGSYKVEWDASKFSSGVYYYRIEAGNFVETRKMVYLK